MDDDPPPHPIIIGSDGPGRSSPETGILRMSNVRKRLYRVASSRPLTINPYVWGGGESREVEKLPTPATETDKTQHQIIVSKVGVPLNASRIRLPPCTLGKFPSPFTQPYSPNILVVVSTECFHRDLAEIPIERDYTVTCYLHPWRFHFEQAEGQR